MNASNAAARGSESENTIRRIIARRYIVESCRSDSKPRESARPLLLPLLKHVRMTDSSCCRRTCDSSTAHGASNWEAPKASHGVQRNSGRGLAQCLPPVRRSGAQRLSGPACPTVDVFYEVMI